MVRLGVGKNMVRAIRHWCISSGVASDDDRGQSEEGKGVHPTALGKQLFLEPELRDPYLEDIGTLWLIHWNLCTNLERNTLWYFVFNLYHHLEFSKDILLAHVKELTKQVEGARVTENTLKTDIDVFLRSYVRRSSTREVVEDTFECPLTELDLIRQLSEPGQYAFNRGAQESLPESIFVFALASFLATRGTKTLSFEDICYAAGSPGKVFKLDESSVYERLERVEGATKKRWIFGETAGLRQLYVKDNVDPHQVLRRHYGTKSAS